MILLRAKYDFQQSISLEPATGRSELEFSVRNSFASIVVLKDED